MYGTQPRFPMIDFRRKMNLQRAPSAWRYCPPPSSAIGGTGRRTDRNHLL